jgi:two-component system cell cycle response regulator DivK
MKKKILIYDDDEDILLLCKAILNKFGFMVETLTRCENILTDIKEIEPDLILIDLWIPEIGGEKAAEMVKENEVTKNIPILIFSSNANIKEICEKVNAEGYIAKPFSISCFNETIQKHLGYTNN